MAEYRRHALIQISTGNVQEVNKSTPCISQGRAFLLLSGFLSCEEAASELRAANQIWRRGARYSHTFAASARK